MKSNFTLTLGYLILSFEQPGPGQLNLSFVTTDNRNISPDVLNAWIKKKKKTEAHSNRLQ